MKGLYLTLSSKSTHTEREHSRVRTFDGAGDRGKDTAGRMYHWEKREKQRMASVIYPCSILVQFKKIFYMLFLFPAKHCLKTTVLHLKNKFLNFKISSLLKWQFPPPLISTFNIFSLKSNKLKSIFVGINSGCKVFLLKVYMLIKFFISPNVYILVISTTKWDH